MLWYENLPPLGIVIRGVENTHQILVHCLASAQTIEGVRRVTVSKEYRGVMWHHAEIHGATCLLRVEGIHPQHGMNIRLIATNVTCGLSNRSTLATARMLELLGFGLRDSLYAIISRPNHSLPELSVYGFTRLQPN